MHDIDRTRASYARRRPGLPLLAAGAAWLLAAAASAQTPPPSAAASEDAAPPTAPILPWRAALEREKAPEEPPAPPAEPGADPAGALGWEIVGGLVPSVAGVALIYASLTTVHPHRDRGGDSPTFDVNLPELSLGAVLTLAGPPIGVIISGDASGGTGSAGFTFLGAFGGLILGVPGIMIGSIIGYRLSAADVVKQAPSRDKAAEPSARLVPILGRHEVGLQWSGTLAL
ncbi:MAG TPA: hypothetical protein VJV78_44570 [Polyangiales bacterium]|nr:hypothetical protein [Polyangiales bacterium]